MDYRIRLTEYIALILRRNQEKPVTFRVTGFIKINVSAI